VVPGPCAGNVRTGLEFSEIDVAATSISSSAASWRRIGSSAAQIFESSETQPRCLNAGEIYLPAFVTPASCSSTSWALLWPVHLDEWFCAA